MTAKTFSMSAAEAGHTHSSLVRFHAPNRRLVNSGPKRTGIRSRNNEMAVAVVLRE